jgi:hypothetical protein
MDRPSFIRLFGWPEMKAILVKWKLLLFLLLMVILSFWCLGFSNGAQQFLKEKMDSPFVRFLSINLPSGFTARSNKPVVNDMKRLLGMDSMRQLYHYSDFQVVPFYTPDFQSHANPAKSVQAWVRPISANDPLYLFLWNKEIMTVNEPKDFSESRWSVVVAEDYLKELGYDPKDPPGYIYYRMPGSGQSGNDLYVPIAISAIVKQLPDDCQLFMTWPLYRAIYGVMGQNPLNIESTMHDSYFMAFVEGDQNLDGIKRRYPGLELKQNNESFKKGRLIVFDMNNQETEKIIDTLRAYFGNKWKRVYDFDKVGFADNAPIRGDKLIVQFNDLEQIGAFDAFIKNKFNLPIDMSQIESRNNFRLFDGISGILSFILSSFSIVFIIYVITRAIINHIENNSRNLGTLKAFGLSNISISVTYAIISSLIVISLFIIAFLSALFVGYFLAPIFLEWWGIRFTVANSLFNLQLSIKLIFLFILVPVGFISLLIYLKLKDTTPGDFIYERN